MSANSLNTPSNDSMKIQNTCVVFDNAGEIDLRLIQTFGAHVKEFSNPIGHFGTGLKYALAVLLRERHLVDILVGTERHTIHLVEETIRGKSFEMVYMSGKSLGFTTEVGKNWGIWQAYRELYSNTMDEPDPQVYSLPIGTQVPDAEMGRTKIIVEGEGLYEIFRSHDEYFLNTPEWLTVAGVEIRDKPHKKVFYRGIAIHELPEDQISQFTYNILNPITMTEDRTAKYSWEVEDSIGRAIAACTDKDFIRKVLRVGESAFEYKLLEDLNYAPTSEEFLEEISDHEDEELIPLNDTFRVKSQIRRINKGEYMPSEEQVRTMQVVFDLFGLAELDITDMEFKILDDLREHSRGFVKDDVSFIPAHIVQAGPLVAFKEAVLCYYQVKYGHSRGSTGMENCLLKLLCDIGKKTIWKWKV